jgi:hypothetical protein
VIPRALNENSISKEGLLTKVEFIRAIKSLCGSLSSRDLTSLYDYFDANSNGDELVGVKYIEKFFTSSGGGDPEKIAVIFRKRPDLLEIILKGVNQALGKGR